MSKAFKLRSNRKQDWGQDLSAPRVWDLKQHSVFFLFLCQEIQQISYLDDKNEESNPKVLNVRVLSRSVVSDSRPHRLQPARFLSIGFFGQEYWSGLPCPSPGNLPDPGTKPGSLVLQADSLPNEPQGKPSMGKLELGGGQPGDKCLQCLETFKCYNLTWGGRNSTGIQWVEVKTLLNIL